MIFSTNFASNHSSVTWNSSLSRPSIAPEARWPIPLT